MVTGWNYINVTIGIASIRKGAIEGNRVRGWIYDPDYKAGFITSDPGHQHSKSAVLEFATRIPPERWTRVENR